MPYLKEPFKVISSRIFFAIAIEDSTWQGHDGKTRAALEQFYIYATKIKTAFDPNGLSSPAP
jgi:hypothetical protein